MTEVESYTTIKKGEDKNLTYNPPTDEEIKNLIEKTGLNKNGNKCVFRKKLIMELNNKEDLNLDENIAAEKGIMSMLKHFKEEKNIEVFIV